MAGDGSRCGGGDVVDRCVVIFVFAVVVVVAVVVIVGSKFGSVGANVFSYIASGGDGDACVAGRSS